MKHGVSYFTYRFAGYKIFDEPDRIFSQLSRLGYDGVEVPGEPILIDAEKLKETADSYGLEPIMVSGLWGQVASSDRDLTSTDGAKRRNAVEYCKRCVDLMVALGGQYFILAACPIGVSPFEGLAPRLRRNLLETSREALKYAADNGVSLLFEPLNRFEGYPGLMNTLEDAADIIEELGAENTGILADLFHMNIEESSITGALRLAGKRLRHVHVVDSNRQAPGMGHLNFIRILRTLKEIGYDGYLSLEAYPPQADPNMLAEASINYLKSALANVDLQYKMKC